MQVFVREAVSTDVSLVATDEHRGYAGLTDCQHGRVHHAAGKFAVGAIHTQTIERFWSPVKWAAMDGRMDWRSLLDF